MNVINKKGYLVQYRHGQEGPRTYVCTDRTALNLLIFHLTGRQASTFPLNSRGLPILGDKFTIGYPLHIWTGEIVPIGETAKEAPE